eukprot:69950-Chlamydomonas_euryale.AAC.1
MGVVALAAMADRDGGGVGVVCCNGGRRANAWSNGGRCGEGSGRWFGARVWWDVFGEHGACRRVPWAQCMAADPTDGRPWRALPNKRVAPGEIVGVASAAMLCPRVSTDCVQRALLWKGSQVYSTFSNYSHTSCTDISVH